MIDKVVKSLSFLGLKEISGLIEIPKDPKMGDYALPCFSLAKQFKKNPAEIARDLADRINSPDFEKIIAVGPYVNFFLNRTKQADSVVKQILKEKEKYGSSNKGRGKKILIEFSSPNIAKPFGIGHLRSTIIGGSIANLASAQGYKVVRINYLGDWGTQFGKLIVGYKKFGNAKELKKDPITHLQEIYVKVNASEEFEDAAREEFRKLESGDKKNLALWKKFRSLSLKEFNKIYGLLGTKFDVISGESLYGEKMEAVVSLIERKGLLKESEGAKIVDLDKYGLGVCLIKKKDGATLYATRDIAAAVERYKKYKFDSLLYEVGSEQSLHFKQIFKVLELLGFDWARNCKHIDHGLYLDSDGKKFSTRKGKTVLMVEVLDETLSLAKDEILKRESLKGKALDERARAIALAAIIYGDLRNYRSNNIVFDLERFLSFEGNTGPYLLYSYVRAKSILAKSKSKKKQTKVSIGEQERELINYLAKFPQTISRAYEEYAPNLVANYAYELSQKFNEFYHSNQVIGSEHENFRLNLVMAFAQVLKNSLNLLGIPVIEKM